MWAIVAVSVFSLVGCCLLAWWQWTRFESPTGTLQNLGYVLQWPLFGVFPAFMFWRIRRAARHDAAPAAVTPPKPHEWTSQHAYVPKRTVIGDRAQTGDGVAAADPAASVSGGTAAVDEEEAELLAYNRYLAGLRTDEERHVR